MFYRKKKFQILKKIVTGRHVSYHLKPPLAPILNTKTRTVPGIRTRNAHILKAQVVGPAHSAFDKREGIRLIFFLEILSKRNS